MKLKFFKGFKNLHPIVFIDYIPRFTGQLFVSLIIVTILISDHNTSPLPYIFAGLQGIVWPHVALYISSRSSRPKWLELRLLLLDSFFIGCWIAYTGFPMWTATLFIMSTFMANISVSGLRLGFLGLFASVIGALVMVLFHGIHFRESTSLLTNILMILGFMTFPAVMGYMTHFRAHVLKLTKIKLQEANTELDEIDRLVQQASATLELDKVMEIIIATLSKIFSFDYVTIQLLDRTRKELYYQALYGPEVTTKLILKELKKVKMKIDGSALSAKVISEGETIYIPDFTNGRTVSAMESHLRKLFWFSSLIFFPLIIKHRNVGVIGFYSHERMDLDEKTIEKIRKHVAHASLVINNAFLYNNLEEGRKKIKVMNEQLTELSKHLSKYISPQVYESIIHAQAVEIGAVRKRMTIFFSDIVGFTELADTIESEVLTSIINRYFDEMTKIILKYGGTVDKYIGDAIMVFFGDPTTKGPRIDASNCTSMALEMREQLKILKREWEEEGIPQDLKVRIGINTGYCAVGNFGSEYRMEYTVIGNQVNLASRLQQVAVPGQIIVSEETYLLIRDEINCKKSETIKVKGIAHPIQTYIVLGYSKMNESES